MVHGSGYLVFIFWILQTSNTSTFLLHEVAKNPDLQDKLYREVTSVLSPDQPPTFEDIQKMPLVRGCSKETLRYILNMGSVQKPATKISSIYTQVVSSCVSVAPKDCWRCCDSWISHPCRGATMYTTNGCHFKVMRSPCKHVHCGTEEAVKTKLFTFNGLFVWRMFSIAINLPSSPSECDSASPTL